MKINFQTDEEKIHEIVLEPEGWIILTNKRVIAEFTSRFLGIIPKGIVTNAAMVHEIDSISVGERRPAYCLIIGALIVLGALFLKGLMLVIGWFLGLIIFSLYWVLRRQTLLLTVSGQPFVLADLGQNLFTNVDVFVNKFFEVKNDTTIAQQKNNKE